MSETAGPPRTTQNEQPLEEKSLLGSAYSYTDVGQMSAQSTEQLADNGDD
ncbi:hypothetical protein [Cellulomonas iranensis]|nr:hypothetical protein [Cellulomonas iranensis]